MPLPPLTDPSSRMVRIRGWFRGTVAMGVLFPLLLVINLLQTLSLILRPIKPKWFRAFNRLMANTWWSWCDIWAERGHGYKIHFTGDDVPIKENAVVVVNHQEMTDIPVLFRLARQKERLGDLKWFVKDILKYVPGVGWGMLFLDCLFIKRNWTSDKQHISDVFKTMLTFKVPAWILMFVEGTRVRPAKIESSKTYAEKLGIKPLNHVLIPRTKGFVATVTELQNHLDAVYDITIGYVKGVPNLRQWARGFVPDVHMHVRRYALADLNLTEDALTQWLLDIWQEKDLLMERFYSTGVFAD